MHALAVAYLVTGTPAVPLNVLARLRSKNRGAYRADALSGLELRAQGAQVRGLVERILPELELAFVLAIFAPHFKVRERAREILADEIYHATPCPRAAHVLVEQYFDGRDSIRRARKAMGVGQKQAMTIRSAAYDVLDDVGHRAQARLQDLFQRRELI